MATKILNHCNKKKFKGLIYKLDYEKDFDSIDQNFLLKVLHTHRFGQRWLTWIRGIL